MKREDRMS